MNALWFELGMVAGISSAGLAALAGLWLRHRRMERGTWRPILMSDVHKSTDGEA